jgi:hypothetical protein
MTNRRPRARRTAQVLFAAKFIFSLLLATTLLGPARVCASGVVTNCDETSLRAALASGGMVTFACDGTIALTSTLIITNDTVIDATGHMVTLDGNKSVRIIHVANSVKFTLINVIVAKGQGNPGGGLWNDGGNVAVLTSTFVENTALGLDGTNGPAVPYKMDNVILGGDTGQIARGGAIYSTGSLVVSNCNFLSNQAKGGAGGRGGYRNGAAPWSLIRPSTQI